MGQAKKELEEKEAREARKLKHLTEKKGYTICVECRIPFKSPYGSIICDRCWEEKTRD
jgi:hypothetical protein